MDGRSSTSALVITLAALSLSVLSIYTTAQGFNLYVPIPWLGWVASAAVQLLILMILFKRFNPWVYVITLPAYIGLLLFSVGGSFLLIDEQLSLQDRRVQTAQETCTEADQYINECETFVNDRFNLMQNLVNRMDGYRDAEKESGDLSGAGRGMGPMYRETNARLTALSITRDAIGNIEHDLDKNCRTEQSLETVTKKPELVKSMCVAKISCGATMMTRMPSDQDLAHVLQQTQELFRKARYQAAIPDMPSSRTPQRPTPKGGFSTLQQRLEGAKDDLVVHPRFSTILSVILALTLDVLLLLIALVSRLQRPSIQSPRDDDLAEILKSVKDS